MGIQSLKASGGTDWSKQIPKGFKRANNGIAVATTIEVLNITGKGYLFHSKLNTDASAWVIQSLVIDGVVLINETDSLGYSNLQTLTGIIRFNSSLVLKVRNTHSSTGYNFNIEALYSID